MYDRIQSYAIKEEHNGQLYELHYYTRFIGEDTEMYLFGNGLGDQTAMTQLGDSFLELLDEGKDPKLGKIIFCVGNGSTAFRNFYGDHVVAWVWGLKPEQIPAHLQRYQVKPDLILSPYRQIRDQAENVGCEALRFWSGVSPRLFKPLGLDRNGIGYSGLAKSREQQRIVIEPAMKYGLEWIGKNPDSVYMSIPEYNEWLNTKKLVLGMVSEDRHGIPFVPTRFFEAMASGTPLITYKIYGIEEHSGIEYPYMTESPEETTRLLEWMLDNYEYVMEQTQKWCSHIRKNHSYKERLVEVFDKLKEMA